MTVHSQNGWVADERDRCQTYAVPGSTVRVVLQGPDVGYVLTRVLAFVDQHVEDLDTRPGVKGFDVPDDWSYAERPIRGGTSLSNHASGTAVDANAVQHPLGVPGTWSAAEKQLIHAHLADYADPVSGKVVVRWGEDYVSRTDGMHFEIVGTPAQVGRVAARLRAQDEGEDDDMKLSDDVKLTKIDAEAYGDPSLEGATKTVGEILRYPPAVARLRRELAARDVAARARDAILSKAIDALAANSPDGVREAFEEGRDRLAADLANLRITVVPFGASAAAG